MSRTKRTIWVGALATGCVALGFIFAPALLVGFEHHKSSVDNGDAPVDKLKSSADELIVHEWGTFTSFAGSNGVNLEYRPLVTNDLPYFVNSMMSDYVNPWGKQEIVAQQRMETPVIYFYTNEPRDVRVRVDFPKGVMSEWYPPAKEIKTGLPQLKQKAVAEASSFESIPPALAAGDADRNRVVRDQLAKWDAAWKQYQSVRTIQVPVIEGGAFLDWGNVRLIPAAKFADVRVRNRKGETVPAWLPKIVDNNHYGRARETDAAIVETVDRKGGSHFEKFLFYRGLGNFELPIKLVALGADRFEINNGGDEASGALLLVRIDEGRVRFKRLDPVGPQAAIEVALPSEASTVDQLAKAMVNELVATGLYQKEAQAMVNTWHDSWFGEDGTRLLYLVSHRATDELLPLAIEPKPSECVRVLVGRLETLTPEDCHKLTLAVAGDSAGQQPTTESIKAELAKLGRFAEPALRYTIGQIKDAITRERLEAALVAIRPEP
jgi:hypothetical protein